jgi:hypothetical protein
MVCEVLPCIPSWRALGAEIVIVFVYKGVSECRDGDMVCWGTIGRVRAAIASSDVARLLRKGQAAGAYFAFHLGF